MADFNEYKGVWVFCEQRQGALMSTDFDLSSPMTVIFWIAS